MSWWTVDYCECMCVLLHVIVLFFFFKPEDAIRAPLWSRGLGEWYKGHNQPAGLFTLVMCFKNTLTFGSIIWCRKRDDYKPLWPFLIPN